VNVEQPDPFNDVVLRHLIGSPAQRGLEERRAVLGEAHVDRALARASGLTADFQELLAKWPWGEVWARPGLDRRARRLLTIGMLVALGRFEELEMHLREALRDGISAAELKEVLLQTAVYAGVPAANSAFAIADRVVAAAEVPEA
jgi:3-oxoadipate enol-lactonase/4-carboxymuconolactone decarboxylase